MLIPLDYYRILGLPIQATAEQLQQAHRDRTLQLPRREYSEVAIVARKQLLDEACAVLSDSDGRKAYDASFLAKTYDRESEAALEAKHQRSKTSAGAQTVLQDGETAPTESKALEAAPDPHTPSIEIDDNQFVGALLVLQELGEYELVQKLGRPYLNNGSIAIAEGRFGDPQLVPRRYSFNRQPGLSRTRSRTVAARSVRKCCKIIRSRSRTAAARKLISKREG